MKAQIRVHGKSQSRTALGIINAYLKLYPDSTLSDLQQAFPKSLNPKSFTDNIIVPEEETKGKEKQYFEKENELIVLKNGQRLALVELWRKDDFKAICNHAIQYGIVAAKVGENMPFQKGSYELEYIDEIVPSEKITPILEEPAPDPKETTNETTPILKEAAPVLKEAAPAFNETAPAFNKTTPASKKITSTFDEYTPISKKTTPIPPKDESNKKRKFNWWWTLALILFLLILLFCWKKCYSNNCSNPNNMVAVISPVNGTDRVEEKLDTFTHWIQDLGGMLSITLPDGKEGKIEKNSSEFELFNFLNSNDTKVDTLNETNGWITLEKLRFETGKAMLTAESENQLKNIAMVMNFFPNSHIKVGGYSDNTGANKVNVRLSSKRAKITAEKLIALGVDANRVTHAGYGSLHPICPANDTDSCRAANRRIDVKIIQK